MLRWKYTQYSDTPFVVLLVSTWELHFISRIRVPSTLKILEFLFWTAKSIQIFFIEKDTRYRQHCLFKERFGVKATNETELYVYNKNRCFGGSCFWQHLKFNFKISSNYCMSKNFLSETKAMDTFKMYNEIFGSQTFF